MSQDEENIGLDEMPESYAVMPIEDGIEADGYEDAGTPPSENSAADGKGNTDTFNAFMIIPVFMLLCICTVLLVLVVNINREMSDVKSALAQLQAEVAAEPELTAGYYGLDDIADINGESVDESEAVNIVEAASLESEGVQAASGDKATGIKRVYLTFDDGPSENTDQILDILAEYDVKATFFVVGKEGYEEQYRRIVEEGHTLAMHSYSHVYSEIYSSLDAYKADLEKLRTFLYEITGVECSIVRFPGGSSNTISTVDMNTLIDYLDSEGMTYFDWNVSSGDASPIYRSASQIESNVLDNIGQFNNAVVLMHDAAGKESTIEALPFIIETILESEDTVLLPITDDTVKVQHVIN